MREYVPTHSEAHALYQANLAPGKMTKDGPSRPYGLTPLRAANSPVFEGPRAGKMDQWVKGFLCNCEDGSWDSQHTRKCYTYLRCGGHLASQHQGGRDRGPQSNLAKLDWPNLYAVGSGERSAMIFKVERNDLRQTLGDASSPAVRAYMSAQSAGAREMAWWTA